MRLALLLLIALALVGCDRTNIRTPFEPHKPLANVCDAACMKPCEDAKAVALWECPDPDAGECWKLQNSQVINPLVTLSERCEVKRASCAACIERSENANATCGTVKPCGEE